MLEYASVKGAKQRWDRLADGDLFREQFCVSLESLEAWPKMVGGASYHRA
ncbi:MAG: hypothetical protein JKY65_16630 [Planctomycetes bacterium]|nr:hypothetical protein [Planctomycetota bacterium]